MIHLQPFDAATAGCILAGWQPLPSTAGAVGVFGEERAAGGTGTQPLLHRAGRSTGFFLTRGCEALTIQQLLRVEKAPKARENQGRYEMSDTKWTPEDTKLVAAAIMRRSATEPAFREKALKNPNAAIQEVAGKPLPTGVTVRFVENQPGATMTFVLPYPVSASKELSEQELEQVAGGRCGSTQASSVAVTRAACVG
jgi:hypothetical protein